MKLEELQELVRAGYTKAEIEALTSEQKLEEPNKELEQTNKELEEPNKELEQTNNIAFEQLTQSLNALNDKIKELDANIKKANILNSSMNAPKQTTAEDVLAQILTPKKSKEE